MANFGYLDDDEDKLDKDLERLIDNTLEHTDLEGDNLEGLPDNDDETNAKSLPFQFMFFIDNTNFQVSVQLLVPFQDKTAFFNFDPRTTLMLAHNINKHLHIAAEIKNYADQGLTFKEAIDKLGIGMPENEGNLPDEDGEEPEAEGV